MGFLKAGSRVLCAPVDYVASAADPVADVQAIKNNKGKGGQAHECPKDEHVQGRPEVIWRLLNTTGSPQKRVHRCEQTDQLLPTKYGAVASVKATRAGARFGGRADLLEPRLSDQYVISFPRAGGIARMAHREAKILTAPAGWRSIDLLHLCRGRR